MSYVVVTFARTDPSDYCGMSHCPVRVVGPFTDSHDVEEYVEGQSAESEPHILTIEAPSRIIELTAEG
jgi:hypothetical protein